MGHAKMLCHFASILAVLVSAAAERGYIMTAPNRFIPGRPETVCIDLVNVDTDMTIEFTLYETQSSYQWVNYNARDLVDIAIISIPASEMTGCAKLKLPDTSSTKSYLAVSTRGYETKNEEDGWTFTDSKIARVYRSSSNLVIIQTDKPIYKPGQLVQFRILTVDTQLKPVSGPIDEVYIETPSGVRVEQWKNTPTKSSIAAFQYQLTEETEQGSWKISYSHEGDQETKRFTVEEYVLPTYEIIITPQEYVTLRDGNATAELCARYTYGKPVKGLLKTSVCLEESSVYYHDSSLPRRDVGISSTNPNYCQTFPLQPIDGCTEVVVGRYDVGWDHRYNVWQHTQLRFDAHVTENGTDQELETSKTLKFTDFAVKLDMAGDSQFKPGLPYKAEVLTRKPNNTPVGEVKVEVTVPNWKGKEPLIQRYVTDNKGRVDVVIPAVTDNRTSIEIEANTFVDGEKADKVTKYAGAWYSPSGSFIQIQPKVNKLECNTFETYSILYSINEEQNVTLFYKVVGLGDITGVFNKQVQLLKETPIERVIDKEQNELEAEEDNNFDVEDFTTTFEPPTQQSRTVKYYTPDYILATHTGTTDITIPINSNISPSGSLIVYYVRDDGEIVSDSIKLSLPECTNHMVNVSFSEETVLPGASVQLNFDASPDSSCAYGIVDKSVFIQGGDNRVTLSSILKQLERYQFQQYEYDYSMTESVSQHCDERYPDAPNYDDYTPSWNLISGYDNAFGSFATSGIAVSSNLDLSLKPCRRTYNPIFRRQSNRHRSRARMSNFPSSASLAMTDSFSEFGGANGNANGNGNFNGNGNRNFNGNGNGNANGNANGARGSNGGNFVPPPPTTATEEQKVEEEEIQLVEVRDFFPETMLFDVIDINNVGTATLDVEVPHTITQWVGNAVCTDEDDGVGVSDDITLTAFQPYFVSSRLPYSAIRGETVPITVTASNYLSECLVIEFSLVKGDDYTVVGSGSKTACVCDSETATETFEVLLTGIGFVNITVNAVTVNYPGICAGKETSNKIGLTDTVIKPILVEPEGAKREYTISDFICLRNGAGSLHNDYQLPLPGNDVLVPQSARAYVSAIGDVMGPIFNNLDDLLAMPYGCGEQNMINFAPNIFVLQYLENRGLDTPEIRAKAIRFMKAGYQRELLYAHSDGSYSAFGPQSGRQEGSAFLTAFVVKSFAQAKPYIYIDNRRQQRSLEYFVNIQQRNGCFPKRGMVHNDYLKGGVGRNRNPAALTAYIVISMLEAGYNKDTDVIRDAMFCIHNKTHDAPITTYTAALSAYAFSLYDTKDNRTKERYQVLNDRKRNDSDGNTFWKGSQDERELNYGRYWWYRPVSADVETTSYALLTTLLLEENQEDQLDNGLSVIRWLSKQRNSQGGFSTTQDTVIGIQALASFASKFGAGDLDLEISVNTSSDRLGRPRFEITDENSLVTYTQKLPILDNITVNTEGKGCFLFQTNVRYNVKETDSVSQPFYTNVSISNHRHEKSPCTLKTINICTRYALSGDSNMAIVEVGMISGWVADKDSLKSLLGDKSVKLRRYEINQKGTVQLYFDKLNSRTTCFKFDMKQEFNIKGRKPGVVTTYDYYKTDERQEIEYSLNC